MELLGTVAVLALVWTLVSGSTAVLVSGAWRWLAAGIEKLHPSDTARITMGVAIAPFVIPTLFVAVCLAPGALGLLGLPVDHCLGHPDHPHLCLVHGGIGLTPLLTVWLVGVGVALSLAGFRVARRLMRARRKLSFLELARTSSRSPEVRLVESPRCFSITAGLLWPKIWLSTALLDALTQEQLAVVEAHERAHLRRCDPLLRLLAGWLAAPILPSVRRSILERLHLASEQACDEAAGVAVGDRMLVADTLLAVARLGDPTPGGSELPVAASFHGSFVSARIHSLLDPVQPASRLRMRRWPLSLSIVAALLVGPLHHTVEHILGAIGVGH